MSREVEYSYLKCECGCNFEVKAFIQRGFKDNEDINCPKCNEFVATVRADMGYDTRILSEEDQLNMKIENKINHVAFKHVEGLPCVVCQKKTTSFVLSLKDLDKDSVPCCKSCCAESAYNNEDSLLVQIEAE
jgi:hypothetical protein